MLKVHHVGYAVKRLEKAQKQMEAMGYEFERPVEDKDRKVRIAFGQKDGYRIELVMPMENGSPVDKILADTGPAPYHICYETDYFEKEIEQMTCGGGYRVIIPPAPAAAFKGRKVVFLYSLALGVVEIVEG